MQGRIEPLKYDGQGNTVITFITRDKVNAELIAERLIDKPVSAEFKKVVKHRSLDQNSYMWSLLGQLAAELRTDKDSVYKDMLMRYGQYITVKIGREQVDDLLKNYTADIIDGEWDRDWYFANIYIGSSQYDSKQMTTLLDGVISECQDFGIEVMSPEELDLLKGCES